MFAYEFEPLADFSSYSFNVPKKYTIANVVREVVTAPVYKQKMIDNVNGDGQIDLYGLFPPRDYQPCSVNYTVDGTGIGALGGDTVLDLALKSWRGWGWLRCNRSDGVNVQQKFLPKTITYRRRPFYNVYDIKVDGLLRPYWFGVTKNTYTSANQTNNSPGAYVSTFQHNGTAPLTEAYQLRIKNIGPGATAFNSFSIFSYTVFALSSDTLNQYSNNTVSQINYVNDFSAYIAVPIGYNLMFNGYNKHIYRETNGATYPSETWTDLTKYYKMGTGDARFSTGAFIGSYSNFLWFTPYNGGTGVYMFPCMNQISTTAAAGITWVYTIDWRDTYV